LGFSGLVLEKMKETHGATAKVVEVNKEIFSFRLSFVGFFELNDGGVVEDMLVEGGWGGSGVVCSGGCVWLVKESFTKFVDI